MKMEEVGEEETSGVRKEAAIVHCCFTYVAFFSLYFPASLALIFLSPRFPLLFPFSPSLSVNLRGAPHHYGQKKKKKKNHTAEPTQKSHTRQTM